MEHAANMFISFDKYLFLEVINILIRLSQSEITIVQRISQAYLRTEAFGYIWFEAKQEMKPYYNIVHKPF